MGDIMPLITRFVLTIVEALQWLLLIRAILSWFPQVSESKIGQLIYMITEPLLIPVRRLLEKIPILSTLPVDFSVLFTWMLLQLIYFMLLLF